MKKLVEDLLIGDTVIKDGKSLDIKDFYEVNGEGRGIITTDQSGKEVRFAKACGVEMTVSV